MTNPSGPASGPFGRTLGDLFTATPTPGLAPVPLGAALVEVPDLSGKPVDTAQQDLRNAHLVSRVLLVETSGTVNTVKSQDPQRGSFVRPGSQVTLYVVTVREPSQFEQMVAAIREAIKPEDLAKSAEITAAVAGLAKTSDVQNLPTKTDLQTATASFEKEADAKRRFEELKGLITAQGGKPPPTPKAT